ncbi:SGNH/GDSL hydrolase family protein [Clostridium sp. SHJSY1]|uniref:SGNH/GDSL hydrolase family protein n=1 Tax=Clostridium sp. SHJSY1 TaxID=2942483 RepID=UPI00287611D0|nr:SGNH/GDSL hydrolase family protein [Clostridium sp. SHJSY1]MDS0524823.1 SGNH/GDSL hydrolase family protein [Clostridium sp. SHJSY1]
MEFSINEEMLKNSIINKGNVIRIKKLFNKAKSGEDIRIGFFGGSITQGCHATTHENSYANRTYKWFKEKFKDVKVEYINAGVGATGSIIGVHRVKEQMLDFNPDIVFIDFAVNDKENIYNKIAYESLIRRIYTSESKPAIVEVFMSTDVGHNVQDQQIKIGEKYNIPMISYRNSIYNEMIKGKLIWEEVATDNVHPNNLGHKIISRLLTNFLEGIYNEEDSNKEELGLGETIFGDKYISGKIFNNNNIVVKERVGFLEDNEGFQVFGNGWKYNSTISDVGKLTVELEGKSIYLLYKKSVCETAARIFVKVDDGQKGILDTYFEDGWGDYSETHLLVDEEETCKHKIEITVLDDDKTNEISIMGFLAS